MTGVFDLAAAKRKRDHPYDCAINMEQELFAYSDGSVWPIRDWLGLDGESSDKDSAVMALAGGDDPNKGPWFCLALSDYGIGPLASGTEAGTGETEGLDPKGDGPVPKADAQ